MEQLTNDLEQEQEQRQTLGFPEEWYHGYLMEIREEHAKMIPPPLPSQFAGDEISLWRKRFAQWLGDTVSTKMLNTIRVLPTGAVILRGRIEATSKVCAYDGTLKAGREGWAMFWSQNEELVARDPFFLLTDADREFLTMIAIATNFAGNKNTAALLWKTFQLSPALWENSVIYASHMPEGFELFRLWKDTIPEGTLVAGLRPQWCGGLVYACNGLALRPNDDGVDFTEHANWLRTRCAFSESDQAIMELALTRLVVPPTREFKTIAQLMRDLVRKPR